MVKIISEAVDTSKINQARRMKVGSRPRRRKKRKQSNILKKVGAL